MREGDLALFLRGVDRSDPELLAREERYFRNVTQLPFARFDYEVLDSEWQVRTRPRWGTVLRAPRVRHVTRLEGFDDLDVERTVGWVVSFDGRQPVLVSDRGAGGRRLLEGDPMPWDLAAVSVRRRAGVLGVFDEDTLAAAPQVMAATQRGIGELDPLLPFDWSRSVVVHHLGRPELLEAFTDVPGGSIDLLGALTFPVRAGPGSPRVASTRLLVLPSSVAAGEPFLGRILRHELSHVAIGPRDDRAPTWFSEGLAEYLGAHPVPEEQRSIPTSVLQRAREQVTGMPPSEGFNGPGQDWHYALSWMACDHVAATAGEDTLWRLLEGFERAAASGPADRDAVQDDVLREVLGHDSRELATRAAARIRELYG